MASYIPCNVDTTPMAREIGYVSNNIQNTTNAVVAMNSAVIAAEAASSNNICSNVNRGFFSLINSQISQKIANKRSRVEALLMQLANQKRRLLSIKYNMEREYNRISSRYIRLFGNINKELEIRLKQTDMPIFDLVDKHVASTTNRMNNMAAIFNTSQSESISGSQQILVSSIKHAACKTMDQFKSFLLTSEKQKNLINRLLIETDMNKQIVDYCVPAIYINYLSDKNGGMDVEVFLPMELNKLKDSVESMIGNPESDNTDSSGVSEEIIREFEKMVENDSLTPRVKELMIKMVEQSKIQTF